MVVYFSGTGNSRFVAERFAELLDDEVVSSSEYIRQKQNAKLESQKPWVFVAPIYVEAIPIVFEKFIKNGEFTGNKKAWFVTTAAREGDMTPIYCKKLAKMKGFEFMGMANIAMPVNYVVYFKTYDYSKSIDKIDNAKPIIIELANRIKEGKEFEPQKDMKMEYYMIKIIRVLYQKLFMKAKKFRATDKCTGCKKCYEACPLGNIKMTADNKPVWQNNCTHCMGCIGVCPSKAIEYGNRTKDKDRYYCQE